LAVVLLLIAFFGPFATVGIMWIRRALDYDRALKASVVDQPKGAGQSISRPVVARRGEAQLADHMYRVAEPGPHLGDLERLHERERSAWRLVVVTLLLTLPLVLTMQWALRVLANTMDMTLDDAAFRLAMAIIGMVMLTVVVVVIKRRASR
jgi:hypothetical protein